MANTNLKPGVEHLSQGATGYYRLSNTWAMALKVGAMTVGAIALANFLAINGKNFDVSIRNVSKCTQMSRTAVQAAMGNLVHLGLADPVMSGNYCLGYRVYLGRTPKLAGLDLMPSQDDVDGMEKNQNMALNEGQHGFKSSPHIKTPFQDSSLRSVERLPSAVPASARSAGTISTSSTGQVGFSFADDQGVIPENDIVRIMGEMRKASIKGDPDDYELRDFITSRIAFMTSAEFKGRKLERGDKNVTQANRNKVIGFCMRIIARDDFKWSSKRVDPALRQKADGIRETIAKLSRKTDTYRMQDGSEVSRASYDAIALDLQTHRDQMIRSRLVRRPSTYDPRSWKNYLEETFTVEVVANQVYGDRAAAHLPASEDRGDIHRQIAALRTELTSMV